MLHASFRENHSIKQLMVDGSCMGRQMTDVRRPGLKPGCIQHLVSTSFTVICSQSSVDNSPCLTTTILQL